MNGKIPYKEQEELDAWAEAELEKEDPQPVIKPPAKKRGRPRKKKVEEPPAPQFVQPPDPQLAGSFGFGQTPPFNPYAYWGGMMPQAQQPAPVNNYYYYGNAPPQQQQQEERPHNNIADPPPPESVPYLEPEPSPEPSDEEVDYDTYANQQASLLKYRFA